MIKKSSGCAERDFLTIKDRANFAEVAKHDIEVVVYTAAESILTGNTRRNKPVGGIPESMLCVMNACC